MFIFTTRLTRKKMAFAIGGAGVLLIAVILLLSSRAPVEASGPATPPVKNIKSNDDRVAYLTTYGWDVSSEPVGTQEVVIPREFDNVFEQYNALQTSQGFDLAKYKGKRIMRYTYEVKNHPTGERLVYATLLIYKNTVIGGDVQSPALDGFMHGFAKPLSGNQ